MDLGQCNTGRSPYVDCTHWSAELIPLLNDPTSNALFPSINPVSSTNQCTDVIAILSSGYSATAGAGGSDGGCYTNCTATLISPDQCIVSVFLLEGIPMSSVSNLTSYDASQVQEKCGVLIITCCAQECTPMGKLILCEVVQ